MFAFSGLKKWEELQQHAKKGVTCTVLDTTVIRSPPMESK